MHKADVSGNAEVATREGMTPIQMKAYKILKAQLANRGTSNKAEVAIFADPQNKKLFDILQMRLLDSDNIKMK